MKTWQFISIVIVILFLTDLFFSNQKEIRDKKIFACQDSCHKALQDSWQNPLNSYLTRETANELKICLNTCEINN